MKKLFLLSLAFASLQGTAQQVTISRNIRAAMDRIDTNTIRSHITYLADDRLKGRLPGSEGYQMAVDYVVDQYKKMGVLPGGDAGGFTQKLVLRRSTVDNSSAFALLKDKDGNADSLIFARDYAPVPNPMKTSTAGEGKLVFAGYGLDIPGDYSDYAGIDVKGKVVVVIGGAPEGFPSTITAHLSNGGNKINTAFAKGAVGVIIVNPNSRGFNNPVIQNNVALNPDKTVAYTWGFNGRANFVLNGTRNLLNRLFINSGKN